MDALLFALTLEVVLLQMRILEGTSELRTRKKTATKSEKAQRYKLERDRQTLKDVVRRTILEIVENGQWSTLQDAVQMLHEETSYPVKLRLNYEHLRESLAAIMSELVAKQSQNVLELRNADQKIAYLRDETKDDLQNANARLLYVDKWLLARHESLEMQINLEPRAPAPQFDHENRVHSELLKAYELQIQEREQALQHWKQRYSEDTAKIDKRLTNKCEQLREAIACRQELQKLFDLHTGEMRSWLTFKSERAARLAREKRLKDAATRLQAWWRGVMVRKALGVFRYLKNLKKTPTKKKK
ncbi:unnamed protein product [Chilo suppressalis]|uniref:Dynein regulatory complex protein 9 n=1 Tax=Chilo suppressalis TaxID=168631 RepID=A0ABN8BGE5_CHISP|nr:hypothetical protein evm_004795 [Chilo suppressalis]CAH0405994.1 unnamed protein product [Chilo suppressalis]